MRFMTRRLLFNHRISVLFALKDCNHSVTSAIPAYLVNNMNSLILGSHMREAFHQANEEWEDGGATWSPDHQWSAMLAAAPEPCK